MSNEQLEAYADAETIGSDPWGILNRDNRNHEKKRRLIESRMSADAGESVLEVGCGHGLHLEKYAKRYRVVGVDISPSLCEQARKQSEATVVQTDARSLPFADGFFESVVGTAVLHHMPDITTALHEWRRVSSGTVTLVEPNYLHPKELLSTHTQAEERHKSQMAPRRVRRALRQFDCPTRLEHRIFTPPWPARAAPVWDAVDAIARRVPGLRATSQLLLIHIDGAD